MQTEYKKPEKVQERKKTFGVKRKKRTEKEEIEEKGMIGGERRKHV